MKQKLFNLLIALALFLTSGSVALAGQVIINGQPLNAETVIERGTTLVPLRSIFEQLLATVSWNKATKTITAIKDDVIIELPIGSYTAYLNGKQVPLELPGKIINNTTLVPLRFVSEALGAEVSWNSSTETVNIQYGSVQEATEIVPITYAVSSDPLYNAILKGLREAQPIVTFTTADKSSYGDINKILDLTQQVLKDYPYLSYVESFEVKTRTGRDINIEITFDYYFTPQKVKEMLKAVELKSGEIIKTVIKPGMSELAKEKALHDYVVLNTSYDYKNYQNNTIPKGSYTAYGVLINGVGVCQGYSAAMCLLLRQAGIPSEVVTGIGRSSGGTENHGWNKVKINGIWYHLDATWDDPVPDRPGMVSQKYFNLTDQQMQKDHSW